MTHRISLHQIVSIAKTFQIYPQFPSELEKQQNMYERICGYSSSWDNFYGGKLPEAAKKLYDFCSDANHRIKHGNPMQYTCANEEEFMKKYIFAHGKTPDKIHHRPRDSDTLDSIVDDQGSPIVSFDVWDSGWEENIRVCYELGKCSNSKETKPLYDAFIERFNDYAAKTKEIKFPITIKVEV